MPWPLVLWYFLPVPRLHSFATTSLASVSPLAPWQMAKLTNARQEARAAVLQTYQRAMQGATLDGARHVAECVARIEAGLQQLEGAGQQCSQVVKAYWSCANAKYEQLNVLQAQCDQDIKRLRAQHKDKLRAVM